MMKKRMANFELLRILCMYMIVVGHCLFHGRVTAKLSYGSTNYLASYLIQAFSIVHVNCFVMLAGYFSIDKNFQLQRLLKIWKQIFFYSIVILIGYVCFAKGFTEITKKDVLQAIFPISARNYWFASVYMAMMLLMPFLGILATRLSKQQYQYLLICLAIFFSINHMIFRVDSYGSYSGRELPWFLFLALLAGYIKLHTKEKKIYALYGFLGYVIFSLLALASVYLAVETHQEDTGYFLNYNSPLALFATISLFICVKNLPWKETFLDKWILTIAKAAFGVYLIHDHYLLRYPVWDFFRASKVAKTSFAVPYAVLIAICVYFVCTCLELLRQQLFAWITPKYEKTKIYQREQQLCEKINNIFK